jgi:DNA polymerase I-like protein with 3'-5' exonuclease and polymerase domains
MTTIALFGTPEDRSYLPRLREIVGTHPLKVSLTREDYLASIAAKVKANGIEAIICTCPDTMLVLLKSLSDFKRPITANGRDKRLTLDDYAGSFFKIPAHKLGVDRDVEVLILNPLAHLVRTAEGPFVFKRFISKITKPEAWFPQTSFTWEVWTPAKSAFLLERFSNAKLLAIDIETYRGDVHRRMHCVGYCALFADGSTHAVVVPYKDMLAHDFVRQLNVSAPAKIFQNGLYDNLYFLRWNVPCNNWLYDTQHLFHSWYAELPKRLDFLTAFSVREIRYWKDDASGGEHDLFEYNARDCWATLSAWCSLLSEVPQWAINNYLMEFPMVFPCLHMEADGLSLDREKFDIARASAEAALLVQKKKLAAWLGDKFNPASPDQCKRLLKVLGAGDVESADSKAMVAAASVHPFNELIISAILAYRKQAKLISTYLNWDKFWNDRLYYKTNPAGTDTGRMASAESSFWTGLQIQNIPQGYAVKSWIRADAGWDGIAEGDKAQAEARCVGYLSGCEALISLVESDKDYHSWNAHKFFGVAYEAVTKPLRNLSKRVNHGANYNMGAQVLLDTMGPKAVAEARILLGLPAKWTLIQVCQHLLLTYEKTYPEVKKNWYEEIKRTISVTKKLVSPSGWTRHFFADPKNNKPALNAAVAHGPQHLNAAILNMGFYKLWLDTVYGDLRGKVRLKAQIHDSVLFCWKGEDTPAEVRRRMETSLDVRGTDGKVRTMLIPSDMSWRKTDKDGNDLGPAIYWSDMK